MQQAHTARQLMHQSSPVGPPAQSGPRWHSSAWFRPEGLAGRLRHIRSVSRPAALQRRRGSYRRQASSMDGDDGVVLPAVISASGVAFLRCWTPAAGMRLRAHRSCSPIRSGSMAADCLSCMGKSSGRNKNTIVSACSIALPERRGARTSRHVSELAGGHADGDRLRPLLAARCPSKGVQLCLRP
jgi:hypothetical protein